MYLNNEIEISVVIPCYNSEKSLLELNKRLVQALEGLSVNFEIIYINDCSKDNTYEVLKEISENCHYVQFIDLMFNVGQFRALICGFEHANGNYIITMDDDLQHPPEEIPKLYYFLKENPDFDAVFGKPEKKKHSFYRRLGSLFIKKINEKIFNKPQNLSMSAFRCLNKKLVSTIIQNKTIIPVLGPLILNSTHRIANIQVQCEERKYKKSNYSLIKLIKITLDNIINFSSLPLKIIGLTGITISLLSFILTIYYFIEYCFGKITVPGWTSLVIFINFYSGLILFSIGVIGEYLIRILKEVKLEPRYVIREIYKNKEPVENHE